MLNGLAQALLKIVCPGVPDFYQGTELWDLSLVDPDNRGRVDFAPRVELLRSFQEQSGCTPDPSFLERLLANWADGGPKLYVIWKALNFRRSHGRLFLEGDYRPLEIRGKRRTNVVAITRSQGGKHVLAAVPRWLAAAQAPADHKQMHRFWDRGELALRPRAPARWLNVLTGEQLGSSDSGKSPALPLREIFKSFPVALLFAETE
jgi:(1->4)-alpha-D-glucan 1-alpha-D-glucosylmutase